MWHSVDYAQLSQEPPEQWAHLLPPELSELPLVAGVDELPPRWSVL